MTLEHEVLDAVVAHQIGVHRLSSGVAKRIAEALAETESIACDAVGGNV